MREQIKIAAKMYQCQESAQRLFKDEYVGKIKWYINTIKTVMEKEHLDELSSILFISNLPNVKNNGAAIMLFMAAAVELIEKK